MQPIKVAHVLNSIGLGGVPEIAYHLMRSLPKEPYELHLYCMKRYTDHLDIREQRIKQFEEIGAPPYFPDRDAKKFYVVGNLTQWLLRNQIDILHTHSYKPNIYGRLAALLCPGLKVVAHYHNYYDNKWEKDKSIVFEERLAPHSDRLVACSEAVRNHVATRAKIPPERFDIILNGTDQERFGVRYDVEEVKRELSIPHDKKVIGIIGRICRQKAQDDFLKAAAVIKQSIPDALFLVIGQADNPKEMDRLKQLSRTLGIERDVIFTGYLDQVQRVYSALDLLVVPSRWEGFGLILVEAMASGTPIVATEVGPIPEVVGREGAAVLVPVGAPDRIAAESIRILSDSSVSLEMIEKAKKQAARFSWERAAGELHRIYQEIYREKAE